MTAALDQLREDTERGLQRAARKQAAFTLAVDVLRSHPTWDDTFVAGFLRIPDPGTAANIVSLARQHIESGKRNP